MSVGRWMVHPSGRSLSPFDVDGGFVDEVDWRDN